MVRRIDPTQGRAAVDAWVRGALHAPAAPLPNPVAAPLPNPALATAVRFTLQRLAERAPGGSVEVRVPPFGAVQCIEGTSHRRGTPPAVIETDAQTWLALATGALAWADAVGSGSVRASGERADLTGLLPLETP